MLEDGPEDGRLVADLLRCRARDDDLLGVDHLPHHAAAGVRGRHQDRREPKPFGRFLVVQTANGVSLDYAEHRGQISRQHYAFLVSEAEFDEIFARVKARGLSYWADPMRRRPGEINHNDGCRGVYFPDPSGHGLEIITRPYGSSPGAPS